MDPKGGQLAPSNFFTLSAHFEALEQAQDELSEIAKRLTQGTFFAVPKAQLSF